MIKIHGTRKHSIYINHDLGLSVFHISSAPVSSEKPIMRPFICSVIFTEKAKSHGNLDRPTYLRMKKLASYCNPPIRIVSSHSLLYVLHLDLALHHIFILILFAICSRIIAIELICHQIQKRTCGIVSSTVRRSLFKRFTYASTRFI